MESGNVLSVLAALIVAAVAPVASVSADPATMPPHAMAPRPAEAEVAPPLPLSADQLPTPSEPWQLRMQRNACFGPCAVYGLVIHDDGSVDYNWREHVGKTGPQQGKADQVALAALRKRLQRPGFSKLVGNYWSDSPACGHWLPDMAKVVIAVWNHDHWQFIKHDYGCSAAPRELHSLEDAIDKAARTKDLVGREE